MQQIGRLCGVSKATVSKALSGRPGINIDTQLRVREIADRYHYRPNALVRSIQQKRSMTVGLAVNDFGNEYIGDIMRGVMQYLHSQQYQVLVIHWGMAGGEEASVLRKMGERRVDGILMFPPEGTEPRAYLAEMRAFHAPMVLLDRKWPQCEYDMVGSDDRQGGYDLTAYLIELGHRRIANLHNAAENRSEGFREAMLRYGVPVRQDWIVQETTEAREYQMARQWLSAADRPTAILCYNDDAAMIVLSAARDLGIRVPQDLSLAGFGDLTVGRNLRPRMTTVRQNPIEIGRRGAELLLKRICQEEGRLTNMPVKPEHILLPTELVVRESTAPPGKKNNTPARNES